MEILLLLLVMGVAMYFLMIRPSRKQQQKQQQMMASLDVGSRVMLTSGIYGTVRHLGEKQAVIEISPGVDLTIMRAAIRGVVQPDEEEFEYAVEPDGPAETGELPAAGEYDMGDYEADLAANAPGLGTPEAQTGAPDFTPAEPPLEGADTDNPETNEKD
ncbi:MAG: preprotein translocase subunit YajC [Propionibacteriaceae bacterium]|jgi:preprotein translocase subunit YajC|nr:preprotein translocase subunit YajC [Propionibacteriaceae bacterium]